MQAYIVTLICTMQNGYNDYVYHKEESRMCQKVGQLTTLQDK